MCVVIRHSTLRPFEPLAGVVTLNVLVTGACLSDPARELIGLVADLGCDVRRCPSFPKHPVDSHFPLWLVVLPPSNPLDAAKRALLARSGRTLHLLGPELEAEQMVELIVMGAGAYLDHTDPPILSAARILAFAQRQISGTWSRQPVAEVRLGDLVLDPVRQTISGPLGSRSLTETESRLLQFLANSSFASPEALCQVVFDRRDISGRGRDLVYRHIANLRSKLRFVGGKEYVLKERSGYRVLGAT